MLAKRRIRALQVARPECYLMTMVRLVTLLLMLVLAIANGPAVASAICQHQDARAHAAAVQSTDAGVAADALSEETAAKATSVDGALGDAAGTLLAGYMLPPEPVLLPPGFVDATIRSMPDDLGQVSRSVPPLLEPPLA